MYSQKQHQIEVGEILNMEIKWATPILNIEFRLHNKR